ncbi:hypothetical protein CC2G_013943 [Coprinopsis cinerea AmutBmut pab1-1]|nr:hypothetical protein CC2G_013943 [Coprinopsis cinerea AmutBmut pab1-1]
MDPVSLGPYLPLALSGQGKRIELVNPQTLRCTCWWVSETHSSVASHVLNLHRRPQTDHKITSRRRDLHLGMSTRDLLTLLLVRRSSFKRLSVARLEGRGGPQIDFGMLSGHPFVCIEPGS